MTGVLRLLFALLLLGANAGHAHDLRAARIVLEDAGAGAILLEAKLPAGVAAATPQAPETCVPGDTVSRPATGGATLATWRWTCPIEGFGPSDRLVLPWSVEGAIVVLRDGLRDERTMYVSANTGGIELLLSELAGESQPSWQIVRQYVALGTGHILSGADHLALVFCLCVMARGRRLFGLITAFTLGHSITLALAFLGWVHVPALPLEAAIALSIAFVAREALRNRDAAGHGFLLVAMFGLLHGMGFAGALSEIGVPRGDLVVALLSFNIGVEIGQLIFVAVVLATIGLIGRIGFATSPALRASVFLVGALSIFWTLERVAAFNV